MENFNLPNSNLEAPDDYLQERHAIPFNYDVNNTDSINNSDQQHRQNFNDGYRSYTVINKRSSNDDMTYPIEPKRFELDKENGFDNSLQNKHANFAYESTPSSPLLADATNKSPNTSNLQALSTFDNLNYATKHLESEKENIQNRFDNYFQYEHQNSAYESTPSSNKSPNTSNSNLQALPTLDNLNCAAQKLVAPNNESLNYIFVPQQIAEISSRNIINANTLPQGSNNITNSMYKSFDYSPFNIPASGHGHSALTSLRLLRHKKFGDPKLEIEKNYIYNAILKDRMGKTIIKAYNKDVASNFETASFKYFSYEVAKSVIIEEFENHKFDHHRERFIALAQLTEDLFPGFFTAADWYTPSGGTKSRAEGLFMDAREELKELYMKADAYGGTIKKARATKASNSSIGSEVNQLLPIDFKNAKDVDDSMRKNWEIFHNERQHIYKKNGVKEVFERYNNYLQYPSSLSLLQYDLNLMLPTTADDFKKNWPVLAALIIKVCAIKFQAEYNTCSRLCGVPEILALILLGFVIPLPGGKKIYLKRTKEDKVGFDILNTFLVQTVHENLEDDENLSILKDNIQKIYDKLTVPNIQPFIVVCSSFDNPSKVYIIFYNVKYECDNIIDAVILYLQVQSASERSLGSSPLNEHICNYLRNTLWDDRKARIFKCINQFKKTLREYELITPVLELLKTT